eukprot:CAMPEP_0173418958 /NCGR_PEP_ID=MMETSP1357-20121228/953_1 /TAXON_ID=77926 /ORGANISM="Hemiselmis rufescens, Strain PCC563" /LENGTH=352 /DNA_ID=CAMNT_0014381513 /DNA_START=35 /DNA_END=1093 /DNA_ORIENTATION=+
MATELTITAPDDFHLHVRDGPMLSAVMPHTARIFRRAIIMPNLIPPVSTIDMANSYKERITAALPSGAKFQPLMTLYLTKETSPDVIKQASAAGITAVKWYPAGATTNSQFGVKETELQNLFPTFRAMAEVGMPLLCHGETTDPEADMFDREALWVKTVLKPLVDGVPELKVVMEHVTTTEGVEFVMNAREGVAATMTVQHMLLNRNALFSYQGQGGLRPHHYCLPILKRESHRRSLVAAATSGSPKFFAGTDSAPHTQDKKEASCGCAGCFTSPAALELYAEVFEGEGKLANLEAFTSLNGCKFYGLPPNDSKVKLTKKSWKMPDTYQVSDGVAVVPLRAGEEVEWSAEPV